MVLIRVHIRHVLPVFGLFQTLLEQRREFACPNPHNTLKGPISGPSSCAMYMCLLLQAVNVFLGESLGERILEHIVELLVVVPRGSGIV